MTLQGVTLNLKSIKFILHVKSWKLINFCAKTSTYPFFTNSKVKEMLE